MCTGADDVGLDLLDEFARVARALDAHGWAEGNAGNLSKLMPDGTIIITGAGTTMAQVATETKRSLVRLDAEGEKISGYYEPSSEVLAHLLTYRAVRDSRAQITALVHTHSPRLLAWLSLDPRPQLAKDKLPEGGVAVNPYFPPGSRELAEASAKAAASGADLIVWEKHGVIALARTLTEGLRMIERGEGAAESAVYADGS
jgi:ribulose-5-phosphate 4-epimerase/fuculose-1-phosphate aldolase